MKTVLRVWRSGDLSSPKVPIAPINRMTPSIVYINENTQTSG
ncbi:hypothetical protein [Grimontia marina]|nr:hypothetical protein [Grimontia marina]